MIFFYLMCEQAFVLLCLSDLEMCVILCGKYSSRNAEALYRERKRERVRVNKSV